MVRTSTHFLGHNFTTGCPWPSLETNGASDCDVILDRKGSIRKCTFCWQVWELAVFRNPNDHFNAQEFERVCGHLSLFHHWLRASTFSMYEIWHDFATVHPTINLNNGSSDQVTLAGFIEHLQKTCQQHSTAFNSMYLIFFTIEFIYLAPFGCWFLWPKSMAWWILASASWIFPRSQVSQVARHMSWCGSIRSCDSMAADGLEMLWETRKRSAYGENMGKITIKTCVEHLQVPRFPSVAFNVSLSSRKKGVFPVKKSDVFAIYLTELTYFYISHQPLNSAPTLGIAHNHNLLWPLWSLLKIWMILIYDNCSLTTRIIVLILDDHVDSCAWETQFVAPTPDAPSWPPDSCKVND